MNESNTVLFSKATAHRIFWFVIGVLILIQIVLLFRTGNGLSRWDDYDEAGAVRSAEAYATEGFTAHYGLPRILFSTRFPDVGAITDHLDTNGLVKAKFRAGFPEHSANRRSWVYTHYPPGPDYLCGVMTKVFGARRLWLWRAVPISLALLTWRVFFKTTAPLFGADRGALIFTACAVLPMTSTYMAGLHYQGYTLTLLLLELCCLMKWFWGDSNRRWLAPALFLVGFLQGWLSFDHFFIVSLAAVPLWLMRRAEGTDLPVRWLWLTTALPLAGFGFAHFLHLLQVAGELNGLRPAIAEFTSTAIERTGVSPGMERFGYVHSLIQVTLLYGRDFLRLYNPHFGPFMLIAGITALISCAARATHLIFQPFGERPQKHFSFSWSGPKTLWPVLLTGFLVAAIWSVVMPAATIGNFHFWPRTFFFFYFILAFVSIRSVGVRLDYTAGKNTPLQK